MTRTVWLLVATFALVLGACGGLGSGSSDLKGTSWTVSTIAGQPTVPTAQPTIVFGSDGSISGSTGCNTYSWTFTASCGKLTVSTLATTRKACTDEAVSAQESAFTAALGSATTFAVGSDGNLTLKGAAEIVGKPGVAAS